MGIVIRLEGVHKAYGGKVLLEHEDLALDGSRRYAVVGPNGAGKSTLLKLILGQEAVDSGSVWVADGLRIGHLAQHDPFLPGERLHAFLMREGEAPDWRAAEVAARLGLGNERLAMPIDALSGGLRTRAKLAALLLQEPDLLILDEPTNFLDLRTQLLLERFLASWRQGALIVSHDRQFLRATCQHTVSVEAGRINTHAGNIDAYFAARAQAAEHASRINAAIDSKARQLEQFIASNRANASTAPQARSKQKQLDKLLEGRQEEERARTSARVRMPAISEPRRGWALRVSALSAGYGDKRIVEGVDLEVEHGSRAVLVGDNGQGKTTLLRTIAGDLPAISGGARWSAGCQLAVYAQHVYHSLPGKGSVHDYLQSVATPGTPKQAILDMAGSLLFRGDEVHKPLAVLSGGERARACLAGVLLGRPTVLLLDEPTNHLDVDTVEALAAGLCDFQGTVIAVSHDRQFLETIATQVIEVAGGTARSFPGTWAEYRWRLDEETASSSQGSASRQGGSTERSAPAAKMDGRRRHELQKAQASAERKMEKLSQEKTALEARLSTAAAQGADLGPLSREMLKVQQALEQAEQAWMQASAALEGA